MRPHPLKNKLKTPFANNLKFDKVQKCTCTKKVLVFKCINNMCK